MSRIPPSALKKPAVESAFRLESGLFSTSVEDTTYALFGPLHYEPGYSYPLIIWLHGPTNDEQQLRRIMPLVSMRNYVAVAPRGLCQFGKDGPLGVGWPQSTEAVEQAEHRIFEALAAASERFHISPRKVFLAGFDQGGTMAFRVALGQPQHFAGVLSLGGRFPTGRTPFGSLASARKIPVFLACGRDSREYQADEVCGNLRLMHTAGMSITLRQYPCGHELTPQMLSDMDRWIIEQITETARAVQPTEDEWSLETELWKDEG
jgi:phospholipase/carboxylesterase